MRTEAKVNIYLDDIRQTPNGFIRTYTVEEAIEEIIKNNGNINILSLDNDLGEGVSEGYKVLDWLEEQVLTDSKFVLPDKIVIHSSNPAARRRMEMVIKKIYSYQYVLSN